MPEKAAAGLDFAVQQLREKMHALTIERVRRRRKTFLEERIAAVRTGSDGWRRTR